MKIPVTKHLSDYLHRNDIHATDLIDRGVSKDSIYRILRRDVEMISSRNAKLLAAGLGVSVETLLNIALTGSKSGQSGKEDDPALKDISLNTSVGESESPTYGPDPLMNAIVAYCSKMDRHQKADVVKLIGMWMEMDSVKQSHCLGCMEGVLRSARGGAASA